MGKEDLFSEIFNKYDKDSVNVDRKEENESVHRFQQTGDLTILDEVYKKRIPTLKNWALKYYYPGLELSIDDFMEELSIVFVKAANKYNITKGSFNTCLYTYLNNRIKNMKNSTHAKKRRPENYDGPISGVLLSLDHTYSNDKSGSRTTLKDILSKTEGGDEEDVIGSTSFRETVNLLSDGDDFLRSVFVKLGEGSTLSSIIRDFKTVSGNVKVSTRQKNGIDGNDCPKLKKIIAKNEDCDGQEFVVVNYDFSNNTMSYSIEFKETEKAKLIQKTIKNLRKNKEEYIRKIRQD